VPARPGIEASGEVVESTSEKFPVGSRVVIFSNRTGLYTTETVALEQHMVLIPEGTSYEQAAARTPPAAAAPAAPAAPPRSWALVTQPLQDRQHSERVAAQLRAVALLQPVPMRTELMRSGTGWRAVFWGFTSVKDAEKVRLALADKGLKTDVMEF
jgi:hypothetical protein